MNPKLDLDDYFYHESSLLLRFALATIIIGGFAFLQVLWKYVWYHRYVSHPLETFVDLMALANVSIILFRDRYSGYYLHGRSTMAHADTTMLELNEELSKAQQPARGLAVQAENYDLKDNQCFEIFITQELRNECANGRQRTQRTVLRAHTPGLGSMGSMGSMGSLPGWVVSVGRGLTNARIPFPPRYDRKLINRVMEAQAQARGGSSFGLGHFKKPDMASSALIVMAREVAQMFRDFISRMESGKTDRVKVKLFMQRFFRIAPDMSEGHRLGPLFLHDFDNAYGRMLFYGIELQLTVWNILVFTAVDMDTRSTPVAAVVTFLCNWFITSVRSELGKNNVSRKSLVDSRFLL